MKTKAKSRIKAKYLNSILRARRRSGPSLRAERAFVLGSSLRKIPHYTIQIFGFGLIISLGLINLLSINSTSALSYSNNTNLQFTLEPSITISVSGDLVINNLSPGSSSDSNIIDVNVITNNSTGYSLSATVGNESNPTTDLVHSNSNSSNSSSSSDNDNGNGNSNSNSNNTFTSLTTDTSSLSDFNDNTWGYNYSNDHGTTWHDYASLPLYTQTAITLNSTSTPVVDNTGDTIKFKIGAKASNTQVSGTYTNVVNFYAITNPTPLSIPDAFAMNGKTMTPSGYYTMQDMDTDICNTVTAIGERATLIDIRDNELYYIAKLKDNRCWLLDNLRLGGTEPIELTPEDTNIISGYTLPASISTGFTGYVEAHINADYKDSIAKVKYGNGSGKVGTYYNYCAASAGTYCYEKNEGIDLPDTLIDSPYDVCPANWRLPTGGEAGEYQNLYVIYDENLATFEDSFSPNFNGGFYDNGQQESINRAGTWWSSTYGGATQNMLHLTFYTQSVHQFQNPRQFGFSVRCLNK